MIRVSGRRYPTIATVIAALALPFLASAARADTLQASSCSKGLAPEAMIIYQATAPKVSPGGEPLQRPQADRHEPRQGPPGAEGLGSRIRQGGGRLSQATRIVATAVTPAARRGRSR